MLRTYGLTHIALAVRNLERPIEFYHRVFGSKVAYRDANSAQLQIPGARDVLVLEEHRVGAGKAGGVRHFGYRLRSPRGFAGAARAVTVART
jgi:catechol 2,3-dioxygenase-like lactoylglutathione lyase family enzyme